MSFSRYAAIAGVVAVLGFSHAAWAASSDDEELKQEIQEETQDEAPAKPAKKVVKKTEKKAEKEDSKTAKKAEGKDEKKADGKDEKKADKKADKKPGKKSAASPLICPESITVETQKLDKKNAPAEFTAFNTETTYWLEWVGVFSGEKKLERVEPAKSTESTSVWMLANNGKTQYYLGCNYKHTSVSLKKPLDESFKTCRVTPKSNPENPHGPMVLQQFACE